MNWRKDGWIDGFLVGWREGWKDGRIFFRLSGLLTSCRTPDWKSSPVLPRAAPRDFPRAKPKGNPEEQPCQPKENPVLPDSFTQIYILFLIGFRIGPPKIHRRFRIGLSKIHRRFRIGPPKIHRRFRIGPTQNTLNLLLPELHSRWILVYHGYYARKATKLPIWNRMDILSQIGCFNAFLA